jgi:hypothetical protein
MSADGGATHNNVSAAQSDATVRLLLNERRIILAVALIEIFSPDERS